MKQNLGRGRRQFSESTAWSH